MLTLIPPSSGSTGGLTYSHNRSGAYVRKRSKPVVGTRTPRQGVVKGNMTVASQAWQLLDAAAQSAWTSYANGHPITNRLGSSIKLTGSQYFIKCAAALLNAGAALPTAPPVSTTIQPVVVSGFAVNDTPSMAVGLTPGLAGDFILVAVAKWTSNGVNFNKTFSQVAVIGSDVSTLDVLDQWVAFAGNAAVGQKAWLRLTPVNAGGLTGSPVYVQTPVLSNAGIAVPVLTSPVATHGVFTWNSLQSPAGLDYQTGPSAVGPWGAITSLAGQDTPTTITTFTTGQYFRGRISDDVTGLAGAWSAGHVVV